MKGLLGLLLVVTLAACSDAKADIPGMEQEIEVGLSDQLSLNQVDVDCPDQIEWQAGEEFHCFAEDGQGRTTRITVSMENDEGEWSWTVG